VKNDKDQTEPGVVKPAETSTTTNAGTATTAVDYSATADANGLLP